MLIDCLAYKTGDQLLGGMMILLVLAIGGCIYFLPSIIAKSRGHDNLVAIFAMNLLLGWIVLGWIIALIWALAVRKQPQQQVVYIQQPQPPVLPSNPQQNHAQIVELNNEQK